MVGIMIGVLDVVIWNLARGKETELSVLSKPIVVGVFLQGNREPLTRDFEKRIV